MFGLLASVQMSFSLNMYFKSPTSTSDVFSNQPQKSKAYVLFLPSKLQVVSYFSGCSASLSSKCKTHTCYVSRLCFRKSTSNNPKTGELKQFGALVSQNPPRNHHVLCFGSPIELNLISFEITRGRVNVVRLCLKTPRIRLMFCLLASFL
jgi:hypothetical protein